MEFDLQRHIKMDEQCDKHDAAFQDDVVVLLNLLKRIISDHLAFQGVKNNNISAESHMAALQMIIAPIAIYSARYVDGIGNKLEKGNIEAGEHDGKVELKSLPIANEIYREFT